MSLYQVTLKVTTVMVLPIEAADKDEAKELALDMPVDEIPGLVHVEDLTVDREVTEVTESEQGLDPTEQFLADMDDDDEDEPEFSGYSGDEA